MQYHEYVCKRCQKSYFAPDGEPCFQCEHGYCAMCAELEALRVVANAAAFASIDLASNLSSAYEEYMRGDIAHGAYQYVLARQASLLAALHKAGYTEKHSLLQVPVKPASSQVETARESAPDG